MPDTDEDVVTVNEASLLVNAGVEGAEGREELSLPLRASLSLSAAALAAMATARAARFNWAFLDLKMRCFLL